MPLKKTYCKPAFVIQQAQKKIFIEVLQKCNVRNSLLGRNEMKICMQVGDACGVGFGVAQKGAV